MNILFTDPKLIVIQTPKKKQIFLENLKRRVPVDQGCWDKTAWLPPSPGL